jgi:hypothetical protein
MNWDGHDDWVEAEKPFPELRAGVPVLPVQAKPTCETLRRKHLLNTYEQVAVPGQNCVEKNVK